MSHINPNPYAPLRKNWMCCRCQKPCQSMAGRRKTVRGYVCVGVPALQSGEGFDMNVNPGDMARIVGNPANLIAIVSVKERMPLHHKKAGSMAQPAWLCEAISSVVVSGKTVSAGEELFASDRCLRRLHDGDGVDEIVARVGKPDSAAIEWALRAGGAK